MAQTLSTRPLKYAVRSLPMLGPTATWYLERSIAVDTGLRFRQIIANFELLTIIPRGKGIQVLPSMEYSWANRGVTVNWEVVRTMANIGVVR